MQRVPVIGYSSTMILLGAAAMGNFLLIKGKEAAQSAARRTFIDFPLMFNSDWSSYNALPFYLFHMKPTLQTHSITTNWSALGPAGRDGPGSGICKRDMFRQNFHDAVNKWMETSGDGELVHAAADGTSLIAHAHVRGP